MKNRRRSLTSLVGLFLILGASTVQARPPGSSSGSTCSLPATDLCADYVFGGSRWASRTVPFYFNPSQAPPGAEQDVVDAFQTWEDEVKSASVEQAMPGDRSTIDFVYMGFTTRGGSRDGFNVVHFSSCDQCGGGSVDLVARRKTISEFDLFLNATRNWSTDLTCPLHDCGALDVQNVATHEVGHVLDLYHVSADADAALTMFPGAAPDETLKRDLGAGDVLGLRKAYPAN